MSIGIYKITSPSNKIYIGKSINIERRWIEYKKLQSCKEQRYLYNSLKKHGPENHIFEIIEECNIENLNEREIFWIKKLNCIKDGLNLTHGGDGGYMSDESKELRRLSSLMSIIQYDLEGNFIKEHLGAVEAIKELGKGNSNNINDCARGKYHSTYGFRWKYKKDVKCIYDKLEPIIEQSKGSKWTNERRIKTKLSRIGETRSKEYAFKISELKKKPIYQYNSNNELINIFPSFKSFNKSGIIGTKKLRNILNKEIYYKEYKYSYEKY